MTHRIFLPGWRPWPDNKLIGVHWAVKARRKKQDAQAVGLAMRQAGIPDAVGKRRVRVEIVLTGRQRKADPFAYHKSLLDALKLAHAIVDDSEGWCEAMPLVQRRAAKGEAAGTWIVLEDAPDGQVP